MFVDDLLKQERKNMGFFDDCKNADLKPFTIKAIIDGIPLNFHSKIIFF
jgi:hypothetical protein